MDSQKVFTSIGEQNYIVVQGFMITELNLKGNELLIYAIIHGFSQEGTQWFCGGLNYLTEFTNSTKQGVLKAINSLCNKNYIEKQEKHINGVKVVYYRSTKLNGGKQSLIGGQQSLTPIKQSSPKNKDNINEYNKEIIYIVEYLNKMANTKYKTCTDSTINIITSRLKEGFTVDDFKAVIDKKVAEWKDTDMGAYLRPQTLFGSKFESYLNTNTRLNPARNDEFDKFDFKSEEENND